MELAARTGAWTPSGAPLPYLRRVAYLESSGTQWIDTGFVFDGTTKVFVDGLIPSIATRALVCSAGVGQSDFYICIAPSTSVYRSAWGSTSRSGMDFDAQRHEFESSLSGGFFIDGNLIARFGTNGFSYGRTIALFRRENMLNGTCKIFAFKINDGLDADYIPVLDLSGRPAMYDEVSGQFFYNQGTGEFTWGEL